MQDQTGFVLPPAFEERRSHAFNKIKWHAPDKAGKFLDIGCGTGNGLIAALQNGFDFAVGVDRNLHEFGHVIKQDNFAEACRLYGVNPMQTLLIEGSIFEFKFAEGSFDCAMMLDSIEHVPEPNQFIQYAYQVLRPGGYFILDTCPLYYSVVGHHLFEIFDSSEPWAHLRQGFEEKLANSNVSDWSKERFLELNRVTHSNIISFLTNSGFEVVHEHRAKPEAADLEMLDRVRHEIAWNGDFTEEELFENWILVVARKPG